MARERPQVIIVRQGGDHGCLITILLLVIAWPLAVLYRAPAAARVGPSARPSTGSPGAPGDAAVADGAAPGERAVTTHDRRAAGPGPRCAARSWSRGPVLRAGAPRPRRAHGRRVRLAAAHGVPRRAARVPDRPAGHEPGAPAPPRPRRGGGRGLQPGDRRHRAVRGGHRAGRRSGRRRTWRAASTRSPTRSRRWSAASARRGSTARSSTWRRSWRMSSAGRCRP